MVEELRDELRSRSGPRLPVGVTVELVSALSERIGYRDAAGQLDGARQDRDEAIELLGQLRTVWQAGPAWADQPGGTAVSWGWVHGARAELLMQRYWDDGANRGPGDLGAAIDDARTGIRCLRAERQREPGGPGGNSDQEIMLQLSSMLGLLLAVRFEQGSDRADRDEALACLELATQQAEPDPVLVDTLALLLSHRYGESQQPPEGTR